MDFSKRFEIETTQKALPMQRFFFASFAQPNIFYIFSIIKIAFLFTARLATISDTYLLSVSSIDLLSVSSLETFMFSPLGA